MTNTARANRPLPADWAQQKPVLYRRESSELSVIDDGASSVSALTLDGISSLSDPWDTVERDEALGHFEPPEMAGHNDDTETSFRDYDAAAANDGNVEESQESMIVNSADTLLQMPHIDYQQQSSILSALFEPEVEANNARLPGALKVKMAEDKAQKGRPTISQRSEPESFVTLARRILLDIKPLGFVLVLCSILCSMNFSSPQNQHTRMVSPICESQSDWATIPLSQPTTLLATETVWNDRTAWTFKLPSELDTQASAPCLNIKLRDNRGLFLPMRAEYSAESGLIAVQESSVDDKVNVDEIWIFTTKAPFVNARLTRKPRRDIQELLTGTTLKNLVNSTRLRVEAEKLWRQEKVFWQAVKVDAAETLKKAGEQAEVFAHQASIALSDLARQTEIFRKRSATDISKKSALAARWLEKRYVKSVINLQLMERTVSAQLQRDYRRISANISKFMAKRKLNKLTKRQHLRTKKMVKGFQEAWQRKVREIQKGFLKAGWRLNALTAKKPLTKGNKRKSRND